MKIRLLILLFAILFIIGATGCSQNKTSNDKTNQGQNTVEETVELTESPTENPLEGKVAEDYVFTENECQIPYHGGFLITDEKSNEKDTARCRLPQLNLEI